MAEPLSILEFGRQLLETGDLDPVYIVLYEAKLGADELERWLLAYWCFYHVGTASWITDQNEYWPAMLEAAGSKEYPRSAERRHYRGTFAVKSVRWLEEQGLEALLSPLTESGPLTVERVVGIVKSWYGFGSWIAFKVADMLERLGLADITFDEKSVLLYDSPRKGAEELYAARFGGRGDPCQAPAYALRLLTRQSGGLGALLAPPRYERVINVQEVETTLCKYHSYRHGHYHVGEDLEAVRHGLLRFPNSTTADRLLQAGRKVELWDT